jgi:hypothetical protein
VPKCEDTTGAVGASIIDTLRTRGTHGTPGTLYSWHPWHPHPGTHPLSDLPEFAGSNRPPSIGRRWESIMSIFVASTSAFLAISSSG